MAFSTQAATNHLVDARKPYLRTAGEEPIPGYVLLEPLGRGGFGEVWKAEAPGGLQKAIKFVSADPELTDQTGSYALRQEYEAFQTIKLIRHPFLLQLERVELLDHDLVMVMELADEHLQDRFNLCRQNGLQGIPRNELLSYMADAAEALDIISTRHGLQHLDIKPANLFLISGRAKVGDYGLVARLGGSSGVANPQRGLTPRYVAPEVLRGQIDIRSDQYSLALVYFELLTAAFPYQARNPQQMMMMHVSAKPELAALPESDRSIIARCLAKKPEDRYPSCLAMVHALLSTASVRESDTMAPPETMFDLVRRARSSEQSASDLALPIPLTSEPRSPESGHVAPRPVPQAFGTKSPLPYASNDVITPRNRPQTMAYPAAAEHSHSGSAASKISSAETATHAIQSAKTTRPTSDNRTNSLPQLTTIRQKPAGFIFPAPTPIPPVIEPEVTISLVEATPAAAPVRLPDVRSILPVALLMGESANPPPIWADQYVNMIFSAAAQGTLVRSSLDPIRSADGTWTCRFPTTMAANVVPLKLQPLIDEEWFDEIDKNRPGYFILRRFTVASGMWNKLSGKKGGMEAVLRWPTRPGLGEVEVQIRFFGIVDQSFRQGIEEVVPSVMSEIRGVLSNVEERRKSPRVMCDMPVRLFPLDHDLTVLKMVPARCRDISTGGMNLQTSEAVRSRYAFAAFDLSGPAEGLAILVRMVREMMTLDGHQVTGARFRTDL